MRASARLEGPEGQVAEVHPGDLLGRSARSALRLDDPRVSEAHALVSLRSGALKLLALRGALAVDRRRVTEVDLAAGLTVHLARGVALHVLEVTLPSTLLAARLGDAAPALLTGSVQSIGGDPPGLTPGFREDARAHVWCTGEAWMVREVGGSPRSVEGGLVIDVSGTPVRFVEVELARAGPASTVDAGRIHPALHLVARYQSVHIHRPGRPVVSLSGQPAVLVSELVAMDGPVDWLVLAKQIWRRHSRRDLLRKKLDATLLRLRKRLEAEDVRPDLVRADGTGRIELVLHDGDRVEDLT
jgi:hypothetical protein